MIDPTVQKNASPRFASLERWMPGLHTLRTYKAAWLPRDLVSGAVLCALLVPQGMAYAELAGLPPINGLYTTVVCLLAYAAFGPSPFLILGPDSSLGPMIAAAIIPLSGGNTEYAVALAGMLALIVGMICVFAGLARLGFVADLISKPVRVGYLAGLAVTIFIGQLPKLFGYSVDANGLVQEFIAFLKNLDQTNPWTLAVGLLTLFLILGLKRWAPRVPGILVAVIVSIVVIVGFDLPAKGVTTVGVLPQGFPSPSLPRVDLSALPVLVATAFGISLVAVGDTISTSAGFAARRGYEVDGDQEMVGIGSANLLAGLFQGFPVSTSGSRTAVAEQAGAKTQLTGVVAAALVLAMLLFVPGLLQNMPNSALAAIIMTASLSLFDVGELRRLYSVRKSEFVLATVSILGVALVGVLQGIVIAVVLSIIQFFERAWRPNTAVLGKTEGISGYHDISRYPNAIQLPGLLMIRWEAPFIFANANLFRKKIRELIAQTVPPPVWVVITAEPVTDIDTTAGDMLVDLDLELNAAGIHLVFAELKDSVKEKIELYGLLETIDHRHFYPTIDVAVEEFQREHPTSTQPNEQKLDRAA
jgi:high affinity sulfate transporter 1